MTQGNPRDKKKESLLTAKVGPLLQGRVEQYTSVNTIIDDANLPAEAADYIRKVIRRAKLRRGERFDAARALVEQFNPQTNGGNAAAVTIHSLGSPSTHASALHRAYFRKRSWPRRAWYHTRRLVACVMVVVSLIWLALGLFVATRHPTISHDYLGQINAELEAFPEDQRAWPIYEDAGTQIQQLPRMFPEDIWLIDEIAPGTPEWTHVTDWLNTNQALIEQIREATLLPTAGIRYKLQEVTFTYSNPRREEKKDSLIALDGLHLHTFAALKEVLATDAYVAVHERDAKRTLANWYALLRLSAHLRRGPTVDQLTSLGIRAFALESILHSLQTAPDLFSDAELLELQQTIIAQGELPTFSFEVERLVMMNFLQHVYSDDGDGNGYITMNFIPISQDRLPTADGNLGRTLTGGPILLATSPTRREMRGYIDSHFDHETAALTAPYREYQRWDESQISWRYRWPRYLIQSSDRLRSVVEYARGSIEGVVIGIALERYRRHTGAFPDSLDQLVPRFVTEIPVDRYTGNPLQYRLTDGHPVVYSVGPNHKDDGGTPPLKNRSSFRPGPYIPQATGDWILYPKISPQY